MVRPWEWAIEIVSETEVVERARKMREGQSPLVTAGYAPKATTGHHRGKRRPARKKVDTHAPQEGQAPLF